MELACVRSSEGVSDRDDSLLVGPGYDARREREREKEGDSK